MGDDLAAARREHWLGHSEAVSRKHYLQVPKELFDRATGRKGPAAESAAKGTAPSTAQSTAAGSCTGSHQAEGVDEDGTTADAQVPSPAEVSDNLREDATARENAPRRTRTFDPLIKSQLLYQLS